MKGFFSSDDVKQSREPMPLLAQCGKCRLNKDCQSPYMPVSGKGQRGVLIVGEAPGEKEDEQNRQFVGKTGQRLRRTLESLGADPDRDCWFTNAIICRPKDNRLPVAAIDHCRPNLFKTIKELQPKTIILLGSPAVRALIGWLWYEDPGGITRWAGFRIPSRLNAWICPTFHPSYLERSEDSVLDLIWRRHLKRALAKRDRPWVEVPSYGAQVQRIYGPEEAAEEVLKFCKAEAVAFDYETTCLKPDGPDARIVSCSVSDGHTTIAFPWHKASRLATWDLLRSGVKKVASNLKFEERWTRKEFGRGVRNWYWDTMIAAHVLDNRPRVGSIKFQAFVHLGQEGYNDHIKPAIKSSGGNAANKIHEVPLPELLLYNGLDSLLEILVARKQRKLLFKEG